MSFTFCCRYPTPLEYTRVIDAFIRKYPDQADRPVDGLRWAGVTDQGVSAYYSILGYMETSILLQFSFCYNVSLSLSALSLLGGTP